VGVGLLVGVIGAAGAEHLALREQLGVHLKPYYRFVFNRRLCGHNRSRISISSGVVGGKERVCVASRLMFNRKGVYFKTYPLFFISRVSVG
jgi:hypothetical protein